MRSGRALALLATQVVPSQAQAHTASNSAGFPRRGGQRGVVIGAIGGGHRAGARRRAKDEAGVKHSRSEDGELAGAGCGEGVGPSGESFALVWLGARCPCGLRHQILQCNIFESKTSCYSLPNPLGFRVATEN